MEITARTICDSVSQQGYRLYTGLIHHPKFIHAEFLRHRSFSISAQSSRAVPVSKILEIVRNSALRAAPVYWGAEQRGMQSGEELDDSVTVGMGNLTRRGMVQLAWNQAAHLAAETAERMASYGAHKSIVNRILEPYTPINVLFTSSEPGLMNFFGLRLDRAAQPEMRVLAERMWVAWNESVPGLLKPGDWHLPFVDFVRSPDYGTNPVSGDYMDDGVTLSQQTAIKVSVARCARLSYASFETGKRSTVEEDLKLYDRLVGSQPMHASPAEHQATPDTWDGARYQWMNDQMPTANEIATKTGGWTRIAMWSHPDQHGNLVGWRQYRKTLSGEALAPLPVEYRP